MEEKLKNQYLEFMNYIDTYLPDRAESLKAMYESFGKRLILAPASSVDYYHNAYPGGYIDHVLRVVKLSLNLYDFYESNGMSVDGFTKSSVVFVALNHDLGKLGFDGEGNERYLPNDSDWHIKNMGKIYKPNEKIPFSMVQDLSLFTLQRFNVPIEWEEFLAIKIHDGLYEESNKPYYISRTKSSGLRTNLAYIIHTADLMASKHERYMWENKSTVDIPSQELSSNLKEEVRREFRELFNNES